MNKEYISPTIERTNTELPTMMIDASNVTGDNGIGGGEDDGGGEGDPDSKRRGEHDDSWGSLW